MGSTTSPLKRIAQNLEPMFTMFSLENLRVYPPCKCHLPLVLRRFFRDDVGSCFLNKAIFLGRGPSGGDSPSDSHNLGGHGVKKKNTEVCTPRWVLGLVPWVHPCATWVRIAQVFFFGGSGGLRGEKMRHGP